MPWVGVSHNPEIKKQVFLERNEVPKVMTFGQAVFKPGDEVELQTHETMYEVFYILSGKAIFFIEGTEYTVEPGDMIMIAAGEDHYQKNPFDEDVTWVYFGVATD